MSKSNVEAVIDICDTMAAYADDITGEIEDLAGSDHLALIRYFHGLDRAYEAVSEAKKRLTVSYDKLSKEMIPEAMRAAGVKSTKIDGIGTVVVSHRYSVSMLDSDMGITWLRSNGHGDLVKETVNPQTLSAFGKNLIVEEGKELPDNIFKVGTSPYTSIRKG